jgi:hypothetical protein
LGFNKKVDGDLEELNMRNHSVARFWLKFKAKFVISLSCFVLLGLAINIYAAEKKTFVWHFDEGDSDIVREATGSGNDGKFNDPGIQWTEGKMDKGLAFAGSNEHPHWIDVPHSPDMDIQNAITMEAWVFPKEISPGRPTIINKQSSYHLRLDLTSQVAVQLYGVEPSDYQFSHSLIKLNEWTHIAVTYDGAEIKFYINGEQDENVVKAAGKIRSTTNAVHFGGDLSG